VYYYFQGRKLKLKSGVQVKLSDWNEKWKESRSKNPILKSDPEYVSKNILLKQKVSEVENVINRIKLNNQIPLVELVKSYVGKNQKRRKIKTYENLDFLFLVKEYDKSIDEDITLRRSYKKSVSSSLKSLKEFTQHFTKDSNYSFLITDIDDEFQKKYIEYSNKKDKQPSTIRKRLKTLISMINWCRKKGYTSHNISIVTFSHEFEKEVLYLSRKEVLELNKFNEFNYTKNNYSKYTTELITDVLKNNKTITYTNYEVYRDMIVFGSGLGCRFGDLVNLKIDNYEFSKDRTKGFFVFRMEKSRLSKQVKIPVNNLTFQLWKKYSKNKNRTDYIFPRTNRGNPISNQKVNKHIKEIGKIVGLSRLVSNPKFNVEGKVKENSSTRIPLHELLTTHIMRRTFIREGVENNIPTHVLMSMSGHTTEKVFRKYFSTTTKELDEEGKKMFSMNLKEPEIQTNEKFESEYLENELRKLKGLFEKGLIPESIYLERVSKLI
jgi:integrase